MIFLNRRKIYTQKRKSYKALSELLITNGNLIIDNLKLWKLQIAVVAGLNVDESDTINPSVYQFWFARVKYSRSHVSINGMKI